MAEGGGHPAGHRRRSRLLQQQRKGREKVRATARWVPIENFPHSVGSRLCEPTSFSETSLPNSITNRPQGDSTTIHRARACLGTSSPTPPGSHHGFPTALRRTGTTRTYLRFRSRHALLLPPLTTRPARNLYKAPCSIVQCTAKTNET